MKDLKKEKKLSSQKETSKFSEKHTIINMVLALLLLLVFIAMGLLALQIK